MRQQTITADLCARLMHSPIMEWEGREGGLLRTNLSIENASSAIKRGVKLVLFNSLTEPITVAGETFVPIRKLKTSIGLNWCRIYDSHYEYLQRGNFNFKKLPLEFTQFFQKYHINFQLNEGEFVPATNEYA